MSDKMALDVAIHKSRVGTNPKIGQRTSLLPLSSFPGVQSGQNGMRLVALAATMPVTHQLSILENHIHQVGNHAAAFSNANVYQSFNRSNAPGLAHPGFSTDTRGRPGMSVIFNPLIPEKNAVSRGQKPLDHPGRSGKGRSRGRQHRLGKVVSGRH